MPSPRAVLSDIHNLALDPKKAWSSIDKNGHLKKSEQTSSSFQEKEEVKPAVVLAEQEVVEVVPEQVQDEVLNVVDQTFESSHIEPVATMHEMSESDNEFDAFKSKKKKK